MKYLRRLLWFLASRMLVFTFCVSLVTLAFFMAFNTANIYVLIEDGMTARANMILKRESASSLDNYFRDEFLAEDDALQIGLSADSPYLDYNITGYEHDVKVNWMWVWPWEDTATATIAETVSNIRGRPVAEAQSLVNEGLISAAPPSWQGGEYEVTMLRTGGRWRIAGLRQTRIFPQETPAPAQE